MEKRKAWLFVTVTGSLVSAVAALIVSVSSFTAIFKSHKVKKLASTIDSSRSQPGIPDLHLKTDISDIRFFIAKLLQQEDIINNIKKQLDALTKPDTTTDVGAQIALTRSDVEVLDSRIQILEDGLLENPEKALAVPLLRKDIQQIEYSYKENLAAMSMNLDRLYDQNKWFIRLMLTMAIGFIGLVVSNFVQIWKKQ